MSFIILDKFPQGSDEWLQARKGRATASQAKSILTPTGKLSKSATGYMRRLARECVIDDPQAFQGNKYTEWGHEFESEARMMFTDHTGIHVQEYGLCVCKDNPILACSPDGLISANGEYIAGLEIKCPSVDTHVDYLMEGILPSEYAVQVHWSMMVTGIRHWYFMSYFPGLNPLILKVEYDDFTEKLKEAAAQFCIEYATERERVFEAIFPNYDAGTTNHP